MLDEAFSGDFLKEALLLVDRISPFRVRRCILMVIIHIIVVMMVIMNFFNGKEEIYYNNIKGIRVFIPWRKC